MKRTIKVLAILSGIMALLTLVAGVPVLFGNKNWFIRFAMFNMVRSGNVFGFIGNLASILLLVYFFSAMCYRGLQVAKGASTKVIKSALIAGTVVTILTIISMICSISMKMFNFGDIIIVGFPLVYTFCIFREIKTN